MPVAAQRPASAARPPTPPREHDQTADVHMDDRTHTTSMRRGREAAVADLSQQRQQLAEIVSASAAADRDHGAAMQQMRAQLDAAKESAQRQARDAAARTEQLAAERDDTRQRCFSCQLSEARTHDTSRLLSARTRVGVL